MPSTVACPSCGTDGTAAANQFLSSSAPPPPQATAGPMRLNVSKPAPVAGLSGVVPPAATLPAIEPGSGVPGLPSTSPRQGYMPKEVPPASIGMGLLGAIIGAALSSGLLYGLSVAIGFRFPLMGVITGYCAAIGARRLYKDTDTKLGYIAAGVSGVAVFGTMFLLYGYFPVTGIISLAISMYWAYQTAGT